jgi:mannose/cellobiose epimerase-like protein (N-acyl-D-glucosamine 2-epimerase family)
MPIAFDRVQDWMFNVALPFWADVGFDSADKGFVEHLTLAGEPADVAFKRARVQARQIYVYSHAHLLGWEGPGLDRARSGYEFMARHGWLAEGGWAAKLGRDGGVVDPTLDFYDQSFMLFALAWWGRASGDADVEAWIDRSLEGLERLARSDGRGYHAVLPAPAEAVQNPHMHLLEALLELYKTTGQERFAQAAREVAGLFVSTFYDPATQTLAEYYDQDWKRAPGVRGRIIEPGHHFEWSWLLYHCQRLTGLDVRDAARGLFAFAETHGVDRATGLTYDEVLDDGTIHQADHRAWPQTEALKAHLAMAEFEGEADLERIAQITDNILDRYLSVQPDGAWIDHLTATGEARVDKVPASTLYHVFLAFAELLRLRETLERPAA